MEFLCLELGEGVLGADAKFSANDINVVCEERFMRLALAFILASILLFGCLDAQPKTKSIPDFGSDLGRLENISSLDNSTVADLNTTEIDGIFGDMLLEKENVSVVYFYHDGCTACKTINAWLESEKPRYNNSVVWFVYNIDTADGWEKYLLFADAYGVPQGEHYIPMVYVGGNYYWGIDGIRYNLTDNINDCKANGCYSPFEMLKG